MKSLNNQAHAYISVRLPQQLNDRLMRLATLDQRKISQMAKVLILEAVENREKELGLSSTNDDEAA